MYNVYVIRICGISSTYESSGWTPEKLIACYLQIGYKINDNFLLNAEN